MASTASHNGDSTKAGDDIMVAGLAFQVFTLGIFMILCLDFFLKTRRRHRELGEAAYDQSADVASLRNSWKFKGFLYALGLATICIFWRSVYRVVELGEGWNGALIKRQNLFIAFEGVMASYFEHSAVSRIPTFAGDTLLFYTAVFFFLTKT